MDAKKAGSLLAFVTILASTTSVIALQTKTSGLEGASMLLQLAYASRDKANQSISVAQATGLEEQTLREAQAYYVKGEASLAKANQTFFAMRGEAPIPPGEDATAERVHELAIQAMHDFKDTIASIMEKIEGTIWPEEPRGLLEAITRAEAYVVKVNASMYALGANGKVYNLTQVYDRVEEALLHIAYAKGNLTEGDVNGTAQEIGRIRRSLNSVQDEVKEAAISPKVEEARIKGFLDNQLAKKIEEVKQLAEAAKVDKSTQLAEVYGLIDDAIRAAQVGNVKEALDLTREAHRLLMSLQKELHKGRGRP